MKQKTFSYLTVCTMTAVTLATAAPSAAYRMIQNTSTGRVTAGAAVTCSASGGFTHWTTSQIAWRHNTAGQGWNKAAALQSAMAAWTNVPSADHVLTYAGTTTAGWATDGTNTILWANGNGCSGSCLALTALVLQSGQKIVESDITFNSNYTWNINGSAYDTQSVAAHEFGHALGIHHSELTSTPRPTMYASYFGSGGRTLETDDRSALQCSQSKYPPGGSSSGGPPTPAIFDVRPDFCLGWANLSWSSSAGATYYEVQQSNSSTYSFPFLSYSGSSTSIYYNGGNGTRYYRVRACNTSGCSPYRNGNRPVHYYSPCL